MKIFKIFSSLTFILSLLINQVSAAFESKTIMLQIDNPIMQVDGNQKQIDSGFNTSPIIINDRTLLPIRAIIEELNGDVLWNGDTQTITIELYNNIIELEINSTEAFLNDELYILDSPPVIHNSRTMLPIRFIAESLDFDIIWNEENRSITIIKNPITAVDDYCGKPYIEVNNNIPLFEDYEITQISYESYSELDSLGRCGICIASIGQDIMPTEERKSISSVKPTGWQSVSYDIVDGNSLYNRCHLIGFQLTGENANKENLITGTRYMNVDGMLPFENLVADYIEDTNNHVMYRVTPVFDNENLVASGVLMEGYSVEDNGEGISFCVYCYNVQPGIEIDYSDGDNRYTGFENTTVEAELTEENLTYILNTRSKKIHKTDCQSAKTIKESNKMLSEKKLSELLEEGYTTCGSCF